MSKIYVPSDSVALALGADEIASAIQHHATEMGWAIEVVRNGSRGLFWLETLVEVETPSGRVGYGPMRPADVHGWLQAGGWHGGQHPLSLGPVDAIPYLQRQQRELFARAGVVDPFSISDYEAHGGWAGLKAAAKMKPQEIVQAVIESGLRGRGGAAFPAGIKWQTVLNAPLSGPAQAHAKAIVCNADEGDSGTFADRMVMEGDPCVLIEGMAIAALATGATEGVIYVRSEYPQAIHTLRQAIACAENAGWIGARIAGTKQAFELSVFKAAGSYVCGEETALLESLEGKRGMVRSKPPLPALSGWRGRPTVINNVLTLASVPQILAKGAPAYAATGFGRSTGTMPFQLAGNIKFGGLVELPFGVSLRTLVEDFGGGTRSGRPIKAIQVGGPLGTYVPAEQWDAPMDYETYTAMGATIGHGGVVVHDDTSNLADLARHAMAFCAFESCGKCTPCRIGSTRGVEVIDRLRQGDAQQEVLLRDLCDTMLHGSLCAMGGMTPFPVLSALNHYPTDFGLPTPSVAQEASQ